MNNKIKGKGSVGLGSVGQGKALSNIDLEKKLSGKPGFAGVVSIDQLPSRPIPGMSLIVNFEKAADGGSHWVAVVVHPEGCFYLDPFGLKSPETLKKWMRKMNKPIFYNTSQLQDIASHRCGEYCFYFVNEMIQGRPIYDILYRLSQSPSLGNEKFMEKYYNSH
jgi:hypothetical protein